MNHSFHTGKMSYICEAEKGFCHQSSLNSHLLTGEKLYVCDLCQKGFSQQVNLNKHLLTHIGEKPFMCKLFHMIIMLIMIACMITMYVIMFTERKAVMLEVRQYTDGNIFVGAGYSSDSQQVTSQICYNATVSSTSAQQVFLKLDTALSFSDLENLLGISVSVGGTFGMFSAEAKASYMRSIQDMDYSMSLNYFEYASNNVAVQLAGYGEKALTESGKGFYNGSKNPYFGLICGDNYIKDYQQGALLIMGINIQFSSSKDKKEFEESAGASFGNIISASESVKSVVTKYKISGSVVLQAFQIGGEPSQLANILNKDKSGQYYALMCNLTAMDNCIKAASGLLDYAKVNFSTQFSFQNNTGLTPLGIGFTQYNPIEYIGLVPPVSLVTHEVLQYRKELASTLKENEYYRQKFYSFLDKTYYPVKLDDLFINDVKSILSETNSNKHILMQPHGGAADCFNFPNKCEGIKAGIDSQLQNITITAEKLLNDMKYTLTTTFNGITYNTGGGSDASWHVVFNTTDYSKISLNVTEIQYVYIGYFEGYIEHHLTWKPIYFVGHLNGDMEHYSGTLCTQQDRAGIWHQCNPRIETRQVSPYFFEPYKAEIK